MKTIQMVLGAAIALSVSSRAFAGNESVELFVATAMNTCEKETCRTTPLPEDPSKLIKQLELHPIDGGGSPDTVIGNLVETANGFEYGVAIAHTTPPGQKSFYTVVTTIEKIGSHVKGGILKEDGTRADIPASSSVIVNDLRDLSLAMLAGGSIREGNTLRQPVLVIGNEDPSTRMLEKNFPSIRQ